MKPPPEAGKSYNPVSPRLRVLIAVLAVTTALGVTWILFERPGGMQWKGKPPPADKARCSEGQTHDCVGGLVGVIAGPDPASAANGKR